MRSGALGHGFSALLCGLCLVAAFPLPSSGARVSAESETIFRAFERDNKKGEGRLILPGYEFASLDAEGLAGGWLSVEGNGWGRYNFGNEYFENNPDGELFTGYVQADDPRGIFRARLGRVSLPLPLARRDPVDGAYVEFNPFDLVSVSAYGGSPVGVSEVSGRSGDMTAGGRIEHNLWPWYTVGLSYRTLQNDGEKQESFGAVDLMVWPVDHLTVRGMSSYDMENDGWAKHDYALRLAWMGYYLEPSYKRIVYENFFDTGVDTGSPFRLLSGTDTRLDVYGLSLGGTLPWAGLEAGLSGRHYDYGEGSDYGRFLGLDVSSAFGPYRVGAEAGYMGSNIEVNRYRLGRAWGEYSHRLFILSADAMYVVFDEPILDEDKALYASLTGSAPIGASGFWVKLSGDYSRDPYFDQDITGLLSVVYRFNR